MSEIYGNRIGTIITGKDLKSIKSFKNVEKLDLSSKIVLYNLENTQIKFDDKDGPFYIIKTNKQIPIALSALLEFYNSPEEIVDEIKNKSNLPEDFDFYKYTGIVVGIMH